MRWLPYRCAEDVRTGEIVRSHFDGLRKEVVADVDVRDRERQVPISAVRAQPGQWYFFVETINFLVGTRVKAILKVGWRSTQMCTGVVVGHDPNVQAPRPFLVEFDSPIPGGHAGGRGCAGRAGHCQWFDPHDLQLAEEHDFVAEGAAVRKITIKEG